MGSRDPITQAGQASVTDLAQRTCAPGQSAYGVVRFPDVHPRTGRVNGTTDIVPLRCPSREHQIARAEWERVVSLRSAMVGRRYRAAMARTRQTICLSAKNPGDSVRRCPAFG